MFLHRWRCSRRLRSLRPRRLWRNSSSRASGTCSSRSSTWSASDRCINILCTQKFWPLQWKVYGTLRSFDGPFMFCAPGSIKNTVILWNTTQNNWFLFECKSPLSAKPVIISMGIFVAITNNTLYGSEIIRILSKDHVPWRYFVNFLLYIS